MLPLLHSALLLPLDRLRTTPSQTSPLALLHPLIRNQTPHLWQTACTHTHSLVLSLQTHSPAHLLSFSFVRPPSSSPSGIGTLCSLFPSILISGVLAPFLSAPTPHIGGSRLAAQPYASSSSSSCQSPDRKLRRTLPACCDSFASHLYHRSLKPSASCGSDVSHALGHPLLASRCNRSRLRARGSHETILEPPSHETPAFIRPSSQSRFFLCAKRNTSPRHTNRYYVPH